MEIHAEDGTLIWSGALGAHFRLNAYVSSYLEPICPEFAELWATPFGITPDELAHILKCPMIWVNKLYLCYQTQRLAVK